MTEQDGGCCEPLRRKCRMDALLKALGLDSKRDYAERIPETLTPEHFNLHEVSLLMSDVRLMCDANDHDYFHEKFVLCVGVTLLCALIASCDSGGMGSIMKFLAPQLRCWRTGV